VAVRFISEVNPSPLVYRRRHTTSLISVVVRFISEVNPSPLVYKRRHTTSLISVAVRFISELNRGEGFTSLINLTTTDMSDAV
jgi:outer membrane scaffolding protein for murein synthesis (MipA/OmpV family)